MKRKSTILLFLVLGLISPSAWAIVGGPWDHLRGDTFSQANTDGLYSASVTMTNGSGFLRFSSRSDQHELADEQITSASVTGTGGTGGSITTAANLASRSNSVIYFEGKTYFGNTYGNVDSKAGSVFGSSSGISVLAETIRSSLTTGGTSAGAGGALIDISGLSETMSLAFTGKVFEKRPQIRFRATGEISFFSRPPLQILAGTGGTVLRIAAGSSSTSTTTTTSVTTNTVVDPVTGASTTTTSTTTTNETEPSETSGADIEPDASAKVRVLGGRISNIVPGPSNPLDLLNTTP